MDSRSNTTEQIKEEARNRLEVISMLSAELADGITRTENVIGEMPSTADFNAKLAEGGDFAMSETTRFAEAVRKSESDTLDSILLDHVMAVFTRRPSVKALFLGSVKAEERAKKKRMREEADKRMWETIERDRRGL